MDKFEHRRIALERLVTSLGRGGIAQVAGKIGKEPNYVSRMLYVEGKAGRKRIGEDSVEQLDKAYPGWMASSAVDQSQVINDHKNSPNLINPKTSASFTLLPVVRFQGLDMKQQNNVATLEGLDWVAVPGEFSPFAKITTMPDSSMYPEIYEGEYIAFDPDVEADAGDTVLLRDRFGALLVRKYRPRTGEIFDAVALNGDYATLHSKDDGVEILAVLVGHWRGRRARRH